ncbi:MAG: hypothetical protein ABL894_14490 [Hyphomicrobium sp.]
MLPRKWLCLPAVLILASLALPAAAADTEAIARQCAEEAAQKLHGATVECVDEMGLICEINTSSHTSKSLLAEVKAAAGACIQENGGKFEPIDGRYARIPGAESHLSYKFEGGDISVHNWETISYDASKTVLSILAD